MNRPVLPREPSEQVIALSRMLQQVEIDDRYAPRRKRALAKLLTGAMREFQREILRRQAGEREASP